MDPDRCCHQSRQQWWTIDQYRWKGCRDQCPRYIFWREFGFRHTDKYSQTGHRSYFERQGCEEIGDWQAEGFILAGAMVPVRWVVQVIDVYREGYTLQIYRIPLDDRQTGQFEVEFRPLGGLLGNKGRGIIAISALARGTTEPLSYHCKIVR